MGLGNLIANIFGNLFAFFVSYVGKKVAVAAAITATVLAVMTAFYVAVKLLVVGVMSAIPNPWLLMIFYSVWPSNAETCFSAIFGVEVLAFLVRHKIMTIKAVASAN